MKKNKTNKQAYDKILKEKYLEQLNLLSQARKLDDLINKTIGNKVFDEFCCRLFY